MDPDKALEIIRQLADSVTDYLDWESPLCGVAADLAFQVTALDDWLTAGGFLPKAWDVPRGSDLPLWPAHRAECERNVPASDCDCWKS